MGDETRDDSQDERPARIAGVLVRHPDPRGRGSVLALLPVASVLSIERMPRLTPIVGGPPALLGVGAVAGAILPVLRLGGARVGSSAPPPPRGGPSPGPLLVCTHDGDRVGLAAAELVHIGHFEVDALDPEAICVDGQTVARVDLAALLAQLQARPWAGRVQLSQEVPSSDAPS